jgi:cytochrome c553
MKANMNPAVASADTAALATALDKAATFAPPGYTNWASIAKDGAKAAKSGSLDTAKAACRTCHDQYKQKYKNEMRGRKI